MENKLIKACFYQKTFLLTDISMEKVLDMPFLTFCNANIAVIEKEFTWKSYTTADVLLTTRRVELINKKEFTKAALDKNSETFVIYIVSLNLAPILEIHRDIIA